MATISASNSYSVKLYYANSTSYVTKAAGSITISATAEKSTSNTSSWKVTVKMSGMGFQGYMQDYCIQVKVDDTWITTDSSGNTLRNASSFWLSGTTTHTIQAIRMGIKRYYYNAYTTYWDYNIVNGGSAATLAKFVFTGILYNFTENVTSWGSWATGLYEHTTSMTFISGAKATLPVYTKAATTVPDANGYTYTYNCSSYLLSDGSGSHTYTASSFSVTSDFTVQPNPIATSTYWPKVSYEYDISIYDSEIGQSGRYYRYKTGSTYTLKSLKLLFTKQDTTERCYTYSNPQWQLRSNTSVKKAGGSSYTASSDTEWVATCTTSTLEHWLQSFSFGSEYSTTATDVRINNGSSFKLPDLTRETDSDEKSILITWDPKNGSTSMTTESPYTVTHTYRCTWSNGSATKSPSTAVVITSANTWVACSTSTDSYTYTTLNFPADPEWTGHTFKEWLNSSDTKIYASTLARAAETMHAIWYLNKYKVKFDLSTADYYLNTSGSKVTSLTALTKNYGEDLTLPQLTSIRNGFTQIGWAVQGYEDDPSYKYTTTMNTDPTEGDSKGITTITLAPIWQATYNYINYNYYTVKDYITDKIAYTIEGDVYKVSNDTYTYIGNFGNYISATEVGIPFSDYDTSDQCFAFYGWTVDSKPTNWDTTRGVYTDIDDINLTIYGDDITQINTKTTWVADATKIRYGCWTYSAKSIKLNGEWHKCPVIYAKIDGAWIKIKNSMYTKINGSWVQEKQK